MSCLDCHGSLAVPDDLTGGYAPCPCCVIEAKLKGLIVRLEHSNTYVLTGDGQRFAISYTKIHDRLLRPLLAADHPPADLEVRPAFRTLELAVDHYIREARIAA